VPIQSAVLALGLHRAGFLIDDPQQAQVLEQVDHFLLVASINALNLLIRCFTGRPPKEPHDACREASARVELVDGQIRVRRVPVWPVRTRCGNSPMQQSARGSSRLSSTRSPTRSLQAPADLGLLPAAEKAAIQRCDPDSRRVRYDCLASLIRECSFQRKMQGTALVIARVRCRVLWRKISYGTQPDHGDRAVERLLTIRETCGAQRRRLHLPDRRDPRRPTGQPVPALLLT
jgi:hypothetical protein